MPPMWNFCKKLVLVLLLTGCAILFIQYMYDKPTFKSSYRVYQRIGTFISSQLSSSIFENGTHTEDNNNAEQLIIPSEVNNDDDTDENVCEPTQNILFLKTHKTGSSTITNILNRYADARNLTMLLPRKPTFYSFDWPNKFRFHAADDTFTTPNFLANHARYSRDTMNVMFPPESTFYISILRHPVPQWESTFQYFRLPGLLKLTQQADPLDYFLQNKIEVKEIQELSQKYPTINLLRNPQFYDLGLDYEDYDNTTYIENAIKTLDNDFDLILLMEYFDESLTLLRRRLCWDIDDVVYFKQNERLNQNKRKKQLSPKHVDKILEWNNADNALYEYFQRKFWNEIEKEGREEFYVDVEKLRQRRKHFMDVCIEKPAVEEAYAYVYVKGYKMYGNLTSQLKLTCERMLKNEIHFLDYFRSARKKWRTSLEGGHIENFKTPMMTQSSGEIEIVKTPSVQNDGTANMEQGYSTEDTMDGKTVLVAKSIPSIKNILQSTASSYSEKQSTKTSNDTSAE